MSGGYDRKDHWYEKAKEEGYRSRAAFKLIELNARFGFLAPGARVLDLGAWPGGWMQVAAEKVGPSGRVVGIDLVAIDAFNMENCLTITGDVRDESSISQARTFSGGNFHAVLSDMSPKLSGIKEADRYAAIACAELALYVAEQTLLDEGTFVAKVFKSNEAQEFFRNAQKRFRKVQRIELDTTRKTSNEFYIVGSGFRGQQ